MQYKYSETQRKIRKNWLLATAIYFFSYGICNFTLMTYRFIQDHSLTRELLQGIYSLTASIVSFYYVKQYAYIKNGTFLLTFSIIYCGLTYLLFPFYVKTLADAILWSSSFILYIWWIWLGIKMKPINVGVQFWKKSLALFDEKKEALKNAKSSKNLDLLYRKITKKWPEHITLAKAEYEARKIAIEKKTKKRAPK